MKWMLAARRWLHRKQSAREAATYRRAHVGPHSHLAPDVHVLGWKNVRIGHHTIVSEGVWINVNDRASSEIAIVIGDNCFIGRRNFLSSGPRIEIGDYCLTGIDCHFLGSDHIHASPFVPYVATGTTGDGAIEVGANCWLGSSVTVLKNVKIGFGSIIGAASVITRDVPPLSVAVGNPGRVIRRFDMRSQAWVRVADYPADGDAHLPGKDEYLATLRKSHPAIKGPVVASSSSFGDLW